MKYIMFEHAGSGNHGCEAIVRTTRKILGEQQEYFLQTLNKAEDIHYGISDMQFIELKGRSLKRNSLPGYMIRLKSRLNPAFDYDDRERIYRNKELIIKDGVALSVGGDNYSYRGIIHSMRDKLKVFQAKGIPSVLWGCSVDDTHLDDLTIEDLKSYSLITARESLTIENLDRIGIRDTVVACSDPAFTLDRQQVSWNDEVLNSKNVIGINVSDFMKYYNAYPDATYRNFYRLLEYLLKETDYYVAMIPHVRQVNNDDLQPILQLAKEMNNERILVVSEDYNCMQLKDIIARCRMFIGCRTHSTIAAYSTCVPTLVVGYSVKAKGIAKDLFGDYEDLLIDVRDFKTDVDLTKRVQVFMEREGELRAHLTKIMPAYKERAYAAKDALQNFIK